jgi:hypothetical protein
MISFSSRPQRRKAPGSYGHSEIKTQPGSQTDDSLLKVPVASYGNLGSSLAPESYLSRMILEVAKMDMHLAVPL